MRRVAADERRCKRAHNLEVVGSNPVPATKNLKLGGLMASELFYCADGAIWGDCALRLILLLNKSGGAHPRMEAI